MQKSMNSEDQITVTLIDNDLPEGWALPRISDLIEINYGKGLKESDRKVGPVPVYGSNGVVGSHNVSLSKGAAIIVGRKGSVGFVHFSPMPCWPIDTTYYIDKFNGLNPQFLMHALRTLDLADLDTSTAIPGLNRNDVYDQKIPLPPLNEQRRIAVKVEELLMRVNATKERLAKVSMIMKRFRQAVLAAACSGRLTADWHEANRVQDDFEESTIGEIAEYFSGFAYKSKIFLKQGQHQVIRIGNVRLMSLNLQASPVFIPDHIAQQTERFRLHPDDIVISMTGTKYKKDYGFAAIVRESNGNLFLNQRVARLRCGDRALPKYLLYWLQTDTFHDFFFAGETGNVNQGNVGADGIRKAPIKLLSLCEQHEIVRRVESMFKLADAVEKRVAFATARAKKLTRAILAKAFRGELVPTEAELARREGRSYETASELLARIKSQPESKGVIERQRRNKTYQGGS